MNNGGLSLKLLNLSSRQRQGIIQVHKEGRKKKKAAFLFSYFCQANINQWSNSIKHHKNIPYPQESPALAWEYPQLHVPSSFMLSALQGHHGSNSTHRPNLDPKCLLAFKEQNILHPRNSLWETSLVHSHYVIDLFLLCVFCVGKLEFVSYTFF